MAAGQSDVFITALRPSLERRESTDKIMAECFARFKYTPHPVTVRRWRKKLGVDKAVQKPTPVSFKIKFPMDPEEIACIQLHQKLNQMWKVK